MDKRGIIERWRWQIAQRLFCWSFAVMPAGERRAAVRLVKLGTEALKAELSTKGEER